MAAHPMAACPAVDCAHGDAAMTDTPPRPMQSPCDDAERRRKALEQLRRNLKSCVKQVEELLAIEERKDRQAA